MSGRRIAGNGELVPVPKWRSRPVILEVDMPYDVSICVIDCILHGLSIGSDVGVLGVRCGAGGPRLIRTTEMRCTVWGKE